MKRAYGWVRQREDFRDHPYRATVARLARSVAPLTRSILAWDQGQLGSCTAHGCGRIWAHRYLAEKGHFEMPSRLFIYYGERALEGTIKYDSGAEVRDGLKTLAQKGCPDEKLWPYDIRKFANKPPTTAFKAALKDLALEYQTVPATNAAMIQAALSAGNPLAFGFDVFKYFESDEMAETGILKLPTRRETPISGHCVCWDGYDSMFWAANSWSDAWGLKGWFRMPFTYLRYCADAWVLTKVS
jgi:C1A family cysteine protease